MVRFSTIYHSVELEVLYTHAVAQSYSVSNVYRDNGRGSKFVCILVLMIDGRAMDERSHEGAREGADQTTEFVLP